MALGGPVKPNTMYEVNEGGVPEMLQSGGRSYLLMGAKPGQVEPIRSSGVVPSPGMPAHVVPQAPAVQPGPGMPARIDVHVNLSVRDFAAHQKHYAVVQAGGPAFR